MADDKTFSKSEMSAMMLWKLGLGNMTKYFHGENPMPNKDKSPTEEMIRNCKPMPTDSDDYSDIKDVPIVVPKWAMDIIKKGHIPEAQEDHWFMYCTHDVFRYYRSWSGMCAYDCHFKRLDDDQYIIDRITVNRDLAQFDVNGEFAAILLLHYLLAAETGCDWRPAWDAFCDLRYAFVKHEGTIDMEEETNEDKEDDRKRPTGLDLKDKIRGCLIGGAVGDALGYEVEFMKWHEIEKQYGKMGIRRYNNHGAKRFCGLARISDDTQMTLFTAGGLLNGLTDCVFEGKSHSDAYKYVKDAYIEWVDGQTGCNNEQHNNWFALKDFMNDQRAPGDTCVSVLSRMKYGESSRKYSKGCGGVMRTAPVALYFAGLHDKGYDKTDIMDEAAIAGHLAWLTHRHPLGWFPSCALHFILAMLLEGSDLLDAIKSTISFMQDFVDQGGRAREVGSVIHNDEEVHDEGWKLIRLLELALKLGLENTPKKEAYKQLGEGWLGDEALAIAVYAAVRFSDNKHIKTKYESIGSSTTITEMHQHMFEEAICCAINHSGDSDSTGAICGQIMGTWLGLHCIPGYYTGDMFAKDPLFEGREENCDLEGRHLLMAIADDLANGCPFCYRPHPLEIEDTKQKMWYLRYVLHVDCDSTNVEESWNQRFCR